MKIENSGFYYEFQETAKSGIALARFNNFNFLESK